MILGLGRLGQASRGMIKTGWQRVLEPAVWSYNR